MKALAAILALAAAAALAADMTFSTYIPQDGDSPSTAAQRQAAAIAASTTALATIATNTGGTVNSFRNVTSATTTTVKSGAGVLHSIVVNKHVANSTITIYDNTAGSGTKIGTIATGLTLLNDPPLDAIYDVSFSTGLTIVTSAASDVTISYR